MDVQLVIVTGVIGLFIAVVAYVSKLFNKGSLDEEKNGIAVQSQVVEQPPEKGRKKSESVSITESSGKLLNVKVFSKF